MILNSPTLLIAIVFAFVIGLVVIAYILRDRLLGMIRRKEMFPCWLVGQEPRIDLVKLPIDKKHFVTSEETHESWWLLPDETGAIQHKPDGSVAGMVITHTSCFPQMPGVERADEDMVKVCQELEKNGRNIWKGCANEDCFTVRLKGAKNNQAEWLHIALLAVISIVGVIATVTVIKL
jgi:hypothetical protein